jgi:hypothetical protein
MAVCSAPLVVKLSIACGFHIFDLWDKTWKRLYLHSTRKYVKIYQEATVLVLSMTAIVKSVPVNAELLLGAPAIHLLLESLQVKRKEASHHEDPP